MTINTATGGAVWRRQHAAQAASTDTQDSRDVSPLLYTYTYTYILYDVIDVVFGNEWGGFGLGGNGAVAYT